MRDSARLTFGKLSFRTWEADTPCGSWTEEQRSQTAIDAKTLRAAGLLALAFVATGVTARSASAKSKIPSRSTSPNVQTGSKPNSSRLTSNGHQ